MLISEFQYHNLPIMLVENFSAVTLDPPPGMTGDGVNQSRGGVLAEGHLAGCGKTTFDRELRFSRSLLQTI